MGESKNESAELHKAAARVTAEIFKMEEAKKWRKYFDMAVISSEEYRAETEILEAWGRLYEKNYLHM